MSKRDFVLTFGSLEDFTDEVLHRNIHTVHLMDGTRDESVSKEAPSPWRRYVITLTARDGDDLLACDIPVGGEWQIFVRDNGRLHSDNLAVGSRLVRAYLAMHGLEVRPGMYTLDYRKLMVAGSLLWQFRDKRLTPRWENFPQYVGESYEEIETIDLGTVRAVIVAADYGVVFRFDDGDLGRIFFGPCPTVQDATKAARLVLEAWQLVQDRVQEVA